MNEKRADEILSAHVDRLAGHGEPTLHFDLSDEEQNRMAPLFQLAERLQQSMQPIQPSPDFVRSLGKELVDHARRQVRVTKRLRRSALIGAAALGSLLSIASVVGAIVFVVARLRARAQARAMHAPTG